MQLKKTTRDGGVFSERRARYLDSPALDEEANDLEEAFEMPSTARPTVSVEPTPSLQVESVVGPRSTFDGRYETEGDLALQGTASGEVVCRGVLTIEAGATAKARVEARECRIFGRVEGDIVCTGRLLLAASAVVVGTIKTSTLLVEEGATVSGSVDTVPVAASPSRAAAERPESRPEVKLPDTQVPGEPVLTVRSPRREVPSFALVSSDDRLALDRN
jgi:cytoskeletal protein CcmA (bactofilin family)